MTVALAALLAAGLCGLRLAVYGAGVSPDGRAYMREQPRPLPFNLRFALPLILRQNKVAWIVVCCSSLVASSALVAVILGQLGFDASRQLFGAALFCGLGGMFHTNATLPVLVDGPAFALMLGAVSLDLGGFALTAIIVAAVGASVKESVPVFAFAATLDAWLLLGLVVPLLAFLILRGGGSHKHGWYRQHSNIFDWRVMLAPWGVCLLGLYGAPSLELVLSLACGYVLLLWAADCGRVYQWACLPLIVATVSVVPAGWLVPLAVAHQFNPYLGDFWVQNLAAAALEK